MSFPGALYINTVQEVQDEVTKKSLPPIYLQQVREHLNSNLIGNKVIPSAASVYGEYDGETDLIVFVLCKSKGGDWNDEVLRENRCGVYDTDQMFKPNSFNFLGC